MRREPEIPIELTLLIDELERSAGVVAIVLGGSRAEGDADEHSDWDLGVYYRGAIDLDPLRRWGEAHPPGSWGRIMNGGAWLTLGAHKVDVVLRDAAFVDHWTERAERGEFEIDGLLAYLAGVPTYLLAAERNVAQTLRGEPPRRIEFPEALAEVGATRWRFGSRFSLTQALARAKRGDVVGAVGQAARSSIEEAHARLCDARRWVLNEKRIFERAGLESLGRSFTNVPDAPGPLVEWVEGVAQILEAKTEA